MFETPITLVWDLMDTPQGVKILEWQQHPSSYMGWDALNSTRLETKIRRSRGRDGSVSSNYPPVISHSNVNKAVSASFLGPDIPTMFPQQKTYTATINGNLIDQVSADFNNSDCVVIKVPAESGGAGVFFATPNEISHAAGSLPLSAIFGKRTVKGTVYPFSTLGHFVVQEAVRPNPIYSYGSYYLPTIRLVASIVPLPDQKDFRWHFHGAYYKLPRNSFRSEDAAHNLKMCAKNRSDILSQARRDKGSGRVPKDVFKRVCSQMRIGLTPLFQKIRTGDWEDFVLRSLESDHLGDHVSAMQFLTRNRLLPQREDIRQAWKRAVEMNPLQIAAIQNRFPKWLDWLGVSPNLLSDATGVEPELLGHTFSGLYR